MKNFPFLFLGLILIGCNKDFQGALLISNANVINIETGAITNQDVLIKDSVITMISEVSSTHPRADRIIDGTDHYLIPGLWDMHVHIQDSSYLAMFLDYGVIGVRDMGGCVKKPINGCESLCPEHLNRWKMAMRKGYMNGPDLFIAGTLLSGTGWPTSFPVSTKEEIAYAFQENLNQKVDFIKVYENIPWESYQEIASLARLYQLDFVGHVSEPFLLTDILDLGQKSIEHIREPILYSFTNDPEELEKFMVADDYTPEDREFVKHWIEDSENVIEAFKRNNAWFTPTMAVQYARQRFNDTLWINHPERKNLPNSVNEGLYTHLKAMRANEDIKGDSLWWMALKKLVRRFDEENIGLLAGSDMACEGGIPGYSLHEELFLMVEEAGISPLAALQTATLNPGKYFNLKTGKVSENYFANLVLLRENPLEDIKNTLSIKAVIKNGRLVRLEEGD